MAGLIKGQILKHLSKFAKNLSPNSINVSTLRGEGELRDLELNEAVLTDVLDLPSWLQLTKATCNRVSIKIQWTKLKSQPICLYLDEVEVTMETCDEPRQPVMESILTAAGPSGKYGLAESIIDGMLVSINSVVINFRAKTFVASIQLSRIIIESKTPTWHSTESLRMTRIKDERLGEILIFKEAEWMTLRIEANALEGVGENLATTPLRLIANQSKIRITIKKRLIDCGVIASRLQINLDDLLWVLTDSQLKAALVFVNSLKDIVAKSARLSKKLAAERLKRQGHIPSPVHGAPYRIPSSNKPATKAQQAVTKVFNKFDIKETSYHLYTGRIDLHLCDDAAPEDESHRRKVEGGAMQVTLFKMGLDFYPYHPAGTDRSHWVKYDKNSEKRDQWAADLVSAFKDDVRKVREAYLNLHSCPAPAPSPESQVLANDARGHQPLGQSPDDASVLRTQPGQGLGPGSVQPQTGAVGGPTSGASVSLNQINMQAPVQGQPNSTPNTHRAPQLQRMPQIHAPRPTKLLESCTVFRLEDFALYRVSTALDSKRRVPTKFMTSDKQRLFLPQEMSSLHAEYTEYYFPEGIDYPASRSQPKTSDVHPQNLIATKSVDGDFVLVDDDSFLTSFVPHSNVYIVINPFYIKMDFLTVLWLNAFVLNLLKKANIPENEGPKVHMDIRLEALMPRVVIPAESFVQGQSDRPTGLQIQASLVSLTNCHLGNTTSKFQLLKTLDEFNRGRLFKDSYAQFPREKDDLVCIPPCFNKHLDREDSPYFDKTVESVLRGQGVPSEMQRATNELLNPLKKSQSTTGLMYYNMMADSFKVDATKDVWCMTIDQLWLEFVGVPSSRNRPVPFVEAFPLTLWIAKPLLSLHSESSITVLSQSDSSVTPSSSNHSLNDGEHHLRETSKQHLKGPDASKIGELPNGPKEATFKTTTVDARTAERPDAQPVSRLGDVHVITNLTTKISVQLNHYQYLFLMRLVDTITSFMDEMDDDTVFIKREAVAEKKLSLSVIVKEVEVALVCPPIPEIPSLQISPEDSDDLFPGEPQGKDSTASQFLDNQITDRGDSALGISLQSGRSLDCGDGIQVQKSASEMDVFSDGFEEVQNDLYTVQDDVSPAMMTSNHTDLSSPQIQISESGRSVSQITVEMTNSRSGSPASRSPSHSANGRMPQAGQQHPDLIRKDSDLKKSFTAMANFTKGVAKKFNKSVTEKVKQNMRSVDTDELSVSDDLETMSMRSGSSDEDDYIMTTFQNQQEAPAFEPKLAFTDDASVGESGSEYRDEGGSMRNLVGHLDRAQGVVSVVCFKVHNSEVTVSIKGKDVAVAATVDHVIPEEHGNVNLDKFHDRFINLSKENKSFSVESLPRLQDSPIRVRFVKGPQAERLMPSAGEKGFLRAEVLDFHAKFLTSTLSSLGDLFDDEKTPEVRPMFVRVENTTVVIKDNKPPTHELTPPTKEPVELFVAKLHIVRREDGQFRISAEEMGAEVTGTPPSEEDKKLLAEPTLMLSEVKHLRERVIELETLQKQEAAKYKGWPKPGDIKQLQEENDQLRRHLEKIGKMSTSSGGFNIELLQEELEKWKEKAKDRKRLQHENEKLFEELTVQSSELLTMKEERESLLATIGFLQEELTQSEQLRFKPK